MRKILALDTPFVMLLAVGAVDPAYIARHKRLHPQYQREHYELPSELIDKAPAVAATTHVLTEASNWLRYCREPMRSEIMVALAGVIKLIDEITPAASKICTTQEFVRFGLTDAAFGQLDPKRFTIVSSDLDLILALQVIGFEVVDFQALLSG